MSAFEPPPYTAPVVHAGCINIVGYLWRGMVAGDIITAEAFHLPDGRRLAIDDPVPDCEHCGEPRFLGLRYQ